MATELETGYQLVTTVDEAQRVMSILGKYPRLAYDSETTLPEGYTKAYNYNTYIIGTGKNKREEVKAVDPHTSDIRLMQFATPDKQIFLVDTKEIQVELFKPLFESGIELIGHNCFPANTKVTLADGTEMKIGDIVKTRVPVDVLSYNEKTGKTEPKRVIGWFDNGLTDDWVQVITESRKWVTCTPNHKIFTRNRGWVEAGKLCAGDELIHKSPALSPRQKSLIYGSLLGDAAFSKRKEGQRHSIAFAHAGHIASSNGYLLHKYDVLKGLCRSGPKEFRNNRGFNEGNPDATLLKFQTIHNHLIEGVYKIVCPGGVKTVNTEWLDNIDAAGLAYWYLDDGCLMTSTYKGKKVNTVRSYPYIAACHDVETIERIQEWLTRTWGINTWLKTRTDKIHYLGIHADAAKFFDIISPFVPPCMEYKIPEMYRGRFQPVTNEEPTPCISKVVLVQKLDTREGGRLTPRLRAGRKPAKQRKFCLEVEGNNNFFADGVLVSNCSFDLKMLMRYGMDATKLKAFCTMVGIQVVEAGVEDGYGRDKLDAVLERTLGITISKDEQKSDWGGDLTDQQLAYAANDVKYMFPLRQLLMGVGKADDLITTLALEMSCVPAFASMMYKGINLNSELCNDIASELSVELQGLILDLNSICNEYEIDRTDKFLNSPKQLLEAFYKMGLDPRDFKGNPSTAKAALQQLTHPFAFKLLEYKSLYKLMSAFLLKLPEMVHPETGCIHTYLKQASTDTGRSAASQPNLMQIPANGVGSRVRECFTAGPGEMMIVSDFDQIEIKTMGLLSRDPLLCKILKAGEDVHTATAREVFNVSEDVLDFKEKYRKPAKMINFLIPYGGGADKLYAALKGEVSMKQCEKTMEVWKKRFAGVQKMLDDVRMTAIHQSPHESRSIIGRRRIYNPQTTDAGSIGRQAGNHRIQSSAADILKSAILEAFKAGLDLRLPVHDELICMTKPEDSEQNRYLLEQCMVDGAAKIINIGLRRGIDLDPDIPMSTKAVLCSNWLSGKE